MATIAAAAPSRTERAMKAVAGAFADVAAVRSVHIIQTEQATNVWLDISRDDTETRKAVYAVQDRIEDEFTSLRFDFHIVPVPQGRRMEDYISDSTLLFQRNAA